jgi:hypothetical protein
VFATQLLDAQEVRPIWADTEVSPIAKLSPIIEMALPETGELIALKPVGNGLSYEKPRYEVPTRCDMETAPEYPVPEPAGGTHVMVVSVTQSELAQSELPMDATGENIWCMFKF